MGRVSPAEVRRRRLVAVATPAGVCVQWATDADAFTTHRAE
jgi:hypothetical protein